MNLKQKVTAVASAGAVSIALTVIGYFEGVRYEPYRDVAGILTVCYGHTGNDIIQGKTYTQQECDELLQKDFIRTQQQLISWLKCRSMIKQKLLYIPLLLMSVPQPLRVLRC